MKLQNFPVSYSFQDLRQFLKSTDFSKAIILGIAITLPIVLAVYLNRLEIGIPIALGALLSSPSDVNGSLRHKRYGILLSALLAVLASILGGYLPFKNLILLPVLGLLTFVISYLSVYGFRASLIAFSGLFALVLSFAQISNALEIYERALLIGVGGLWYLLLTFIWHRINPKGQTDQFLSQTLELTSRYVKTRAKLLAEAENRDDDFKTLLQIQTDLNIQHETLRDILISSRRTSGNSNFERRRLLVLIQLVDILELAMANPVDYVKMDSLLREHPQQVKAFQELILTMAERLKELSDIIINRHPISHDLRLDLSLKSIHSNLKNWKPSARGTGEDLLILQNLYDYQEKQVQKIKKIQSLLLDDNLKEFQFAEKHEASRFVESQDFDIKILWDNLSLKSAIFKHSLRLALIFMIGFAVGNYFSLQNSYWILLTIIVIMRPNYGLTKTRSKQRTIGTLIGAGIAIGIVLLTQNMIVYSVLAVVTLVLAFAMVQKNYKTSAVFVTLSVVFVYALLQPNVLNVIQYRVLDTLIGAGLATFGNLLLWPSWEYLGIKLVIAESLAANKKYLSEISYLYQKKGSAPTSYKLSRKSAFLALGELNSSFQRMTQEPKSQQKNLENIYELVVLNHSFLSSLASMGTYIQTHSTTKASIKFKELVNEIMLNMDKSLELLNDKEVILNNQFSVQQKAEEYFVKKISEIKKMPLLDENVGYLQEAQVIVEQLKWLWNFSEKIKHKIAETTFN